MRENRGGFCAAIRGGGGVEMLTEMGSWEVEEQENRYWKKRKRKKKSAREGCRGRILEGSMLVLLLRTRVSFLFLYDIIP